MIRHLVPNTQSRLALAFLTLLGGSLVLHAISYALNQLSGDWIHLLGLLAITAFGWLVGRLHSRQYWSLAAFAAAGAIFAYSTIIIAFLRHYRIDILEWNSSLFRDFAMLSVLMAFVAQIIGGVVGTISALVGRSRHSLQLTASDERAIEAPLGWRSFVVGGPGLFVFIVLAACAIALGEYSTLRSSLSVGMAIGGGWLLTALVAAWCVGRFYTRHSAVLALAAGAGLSHFLLSIHDYYLVEIWYGSWRNEFVSKLSGAGILDWNGLLLLAAVSGGVSCVAALLRK
jgi:hypothetical protein